MKKIITIFILSLIFIFSTTILVVAKNNNDRHYRNNRQDHRYYDNHHDNNYNKNHHSSGYRYHYNEGKRYDYIRHYRSWEEWERHRRQHPYIGKQGRYFHDESGHLLFGFTDEEGNSFFFSIGR